MHKIGRKSSIDTVSRLVCENVWKSDFFFNVEQEIDCFSFSALLSIFSPSVSAFSTSSTRMSSLCEFEFSESIFGFSMLSFGGMFFVFLFFFWLDSDSNIATKNLISNLRIHFWSFNVFVSD